MSGTKPDHREATLKDVARLAGVSTATVARVLHERGYVAAGTREAVEAAIAASGYRVNAVAQGLRKRRTLLIGHVLQDIAPNPFFASVAHAAQERAARSGCGMILATTRVDPAIERGVVEMLLRQRVDAILFTTVVSDANVALAASAGVPVVQVERVGPVPTHSVRVDNRVGALDAMAHLIGLGHRRIAYIGVRTDRPHAPTLPGEAPLYSPERRSVEFERLGGYTEALAAHGIPLDPALLELGDTYYSPERGREVTARLTSLPPERRPTAIFAGCDMLAAGVLQELHARRLRVPDDLSVLGFDDTFAAHLAPALTTVAQPMTELGVIGVELAIDALEGRIAPGEVVRHRLESTLIVRSSTAPPAG